MERLENGITRLERAQKLMREANEALHNGDRDRLLELGFTEPHIEALSQPDWHGCIGFPDSARRNNEVDLRWMRARLADLRLANRVEKIA
ncbi:hypothetical protein BDI4_660015 [Burkholderia diffusa]|uniref:hypothetical protein n=1 Tax=Burkholderia diffusa TaxID=488732 RepID=UPI001CAD746D|nr:hypothetical protein [Burkholderia diffusa]CAG9260879.1 hypothetical protein BDI4_660015 [Burkholderia diffusa]